MDINTELGFAGDNTNFDGSGVIDSTKQLGEGIVDTAKDVGLEALEKAQEVYDLAAPEVGQVVEGAIESSARLEAKPRVFSAIPNTLLMVGLLGGLIWVLKK